MPNRAKWLAEAKWGVFTHYLATVDMTSGEWNKQIDQFNVDLLAEQLAATGSQYYFITLGQNSGHFCSPNKIYDSLVGRYPSFCSQRDLVADIIDAIEPLGIRVMVYLPSHAPALDRQAVENLCCTPEWDPSQWQLKPSRYLSKKSLDEKLSEFQCNWQAVIEEWSVRWKSHVHGWWFDGCYYADKMYRNVDGPNFKTFAEAARMGNENSIVAFNTGVNVPVRYTTEYEDYTAGEIANILPYDNSFNVGTETKVVDGLINGTQYHILTYLGQFWGNVHPRFSQNFLNAYTQHVAEMGGAITWDVPINVYGEIPDEYIELLTKLNNYMCATK